MPRPQHAPPSARPNRIDFQPCMATCSRIRALWVRRLGSSWRAPPVADSSQFDACMTSSPVVDARIQAHKNLGDKTFAIRATPTLIINGWKLCEPPDHAALNKMVEAALAGKAPVGKK